MPEGTSGLPENGAGGNDQLAFQHRKGFAEYDVPFVHEYLRAQEASGHTAHYVRLFDKHRAAFLAGQRKNRGPASGP